MADDTTTKQAAAPQDKPTDSVTFTLDGREITVPKGTTVLKAALQHGVDIPYFCWHPKLKPVGACRMCYVEIEGMPKLQVSCNTVATDGMVVYTNSDQVRQGRRAIIEFTLINHPLDCPTCDKGGECHLQDLTFAHGFDDSRFEFQKYRFISEEGKSTFDDLRIGPEIILNRNRCILCYKCVRANKEAFGEYDLGAYERGNITEINAAPGQQVANPFSGNLVEICPVGALTNTDWRYKIRVWLTQQAKSVCPFTSSGSNITFYYERHKNRIFRVTSRPHDYIDDGWLADVTRYGYQIVNSDDRIRQPLIKKEGKQVEATWEEALDLIARRVGDIIEKKGCVCLGGIAYPGLDNASLYTLNKFIRVGLGSQNIDYRIDYRMLPSRAGTAYDVMSTRPFRIADIDDSDVILVIGSDMIREHPNEYLRIRKAYNFKSARIISVNPYAVKSADVAESEIIYRIGTDELVVNAVCLAALEQGLVPPERIDDLKEKLDPQTLAATAEACGVDADEIIALARALAEGRKITVIAGELVSRSRDREAIAAALWNLNRLFDIEAKGQIAILPRYANSVGAEKLGVRPYLSDSLRGELKNIWGKFPEAEEYNTDAMLARMRKEEITGLFVFGADLMTQYPDRVFAEDGLERLELLVVADLFETATTELADVVLPLASWAEYDGSYTNLEGRVQEAIGPLKPRFESRPAYAIIDAIAERLEAHLFESPEQRAEEINRLLAFDSKLPQANGYLKVAVTPDERQEEYPLPLVIGDDPHHCTHLTEKAESLLNFQSEAYVELSPALATELSVTDGETVRVISPVGKVNVPVRISDWLEGRVVFMPRNFAATPVTSLLMRKQRVDRVKITKLDD